MRKIFLILLICLIFFTSKFPVYARSEIENRIDDTVEKQLEKLELQEIDKFITQVDKEVNQHLPELSLKGMLDAVKEGNLDLSFSEIFKGLVRYLFKELVAESALLGKLIILAVICAILQNLQSAFEKGTIGKLAYSVTYLVLITIALGSFTFAVNTASDTIETMVNFLQALLPVLLTLLAAMGGVSSAAIIHSFTTVSLGVIATLIKTVLLPLIYFSAILGILSHLSDKFNVSRLSGLFKEAIKVFLGLTSTIFLGLLSIQGLAGAVTDGIALRTAKYATGAFVPVVGGMLSGAFETIIGASILLKNSISLLGAIVLLMIVIFPMLKILALSLIYKLAAAIVQPFGDNKIGEALETMGKSITLVFAALAVVSIVFFISLSVIVGLANLTAMIR